MWKIKTGQWLREVVITEASAFFGMVFPIGNHEHKESYHENSRKHY